MLVKQAYICGPLTELPNDPGLILSVLYAILDFFRCTIRGRPKPFRVTKGSAKRLYSVLADICEHVLGQRAFVPHERFDPIKHSHFTPAEVDAAERRQVCELTSLLVVIALEPTWGGGIEVEMANRSGVPAVILKPPKKISRLLLGNPSIKEVLEFHDEDTAKSCLWTALANLNSETEEQLTLFPQ